MGERRKKRQQKIERTKINYRASRTDVGGTAGRMERALGWESGDLTSSLSYFTNELWDVKQVTSPSLDTNLLI